ncbi:MAG: hypothetical protein F6K39_41120 [Okeania sp. SIO3B3]|nr:hypothetical protein [Okeania sp. SIO3B3]
MRQLHRYVWQLLLFNYWTIVIGLVMSVGEASAAATSLCLAIITIYLLDNSYWSGNERSLCLAIITIYLLDNSYSSFRTLLL